MILNIARERRNHIEDLCAFERNVLPLWHIRVAKKAYQSRIQQQERLANRYLKIGLSTQNPYSKGIRRLFQNYIKSGDWTI